MIVDLSLLDLANLQQSLAWRDRILGLEKGTLRVRIDHLIETALETEYAQ